MPNLYGNFGPDPYLNLIVYHGQNNYSGPLLYYSIDKRHVAGQRNALDIGSTHLNAWLTNSTRAKEMDLITNHLANFVEKSSKNRFPSPLKGVWETAADSNSPWVDIFTYDVYRSLGMTSDAERYKTKKSQEPTGKKNRYWFRDWFLPIYEKHGGNQVLNKYYQLLHDYVSNSTEGFYTGILNTGRFIHFWSAATGADLQELAEVAFGCNEDFWKEKELEAARKLYPELKKLYEYDNTGACEAAKTGFLIPNSSTANDQPPKPLIPPITWKLAFAEGTKDVTRVYVDEAGHVTVFFDSGYASYVNVPELFSFISQVWAYMNQTYGVFGPDLYLNCIVHRFLPKGTAALSYSLDSNALEHRNILQVGSLNLERWLHTRPEDREVDQIVVSLASFVEFSYKKRLGSPSYHAWKTSSDTAWADIFTYDVYNSLKMTKDAARFLDATRNKVEDEPRKNTLWFKNWFMEIYEAFNGTQVLKEYFEVVYNNAPHRQNVYTEFLDMGGFIHFWSGAAKTDLVYLAKTAFGKEDWDGKYEEQFLKAREKYSNVAELYLCDESQSACDLKKYEDKKNQTAMTSKPIIIYEVAPPGDNFGVVIAAVIGSVAVLILIIVIICSVIFYKRKINHLQTAIRALTAEEVNEFFDGSPNTNREEVHSLVLSLPFVKHYELPRTQFIIDEDKLIVSGQFGCVLHGFVEDSESKELTPVAVKTVKPNVDVLYFKAMLSEAKIMASLGRHSNIVVLIATCTANIKNREIFIALEFCPLGDLHSYLKKERQNYTDLFHSSGTPKLPTTEMTLSESSTAGIESDPASNNLSTLDLLKWSQEISNGMVYLTEKKVIHGDLAARNVLLNSNRVAQISDFGLSRQLLNYANYKKETQTPLPWRWMAIESLKDMKFSVASDAWAFGVTLWEIFSLAETPYSGWTWNYAFVDRLYGGERLGSPQYANKQIFELMLNCWALEDTKRPTFKTIYDFLDECISALSNRQRITQNNVDNIDGQSSHYLTLTGMEAES